MYFNNTLSWKTISQEEYVSSVTDDEKLYYIHIEDGIPYLRADIEHGGDENVQLRVELFSDIYSTGFCMACQGLSVKFDDISELVTECRGNYVGGITFIEYKNSDEAEQKVLNDFLNSYRKVGTNGKDISGISPIFIRCIESSMYQLVQVFPNADLFIQIVDEIKE